MHTFLLTPGHWIAGGAYYDAAGKEFPATGESTVIHRKERWVNRSTVTVHGDELVVFDNDYEIEPMAVGSDHTVWTSKDPDVGLFCGRFAIVGDAITSLYESDDGRFKGHEVMQRLSADHYRIIGVFYDGSVKLSSWNLQLRRQVSY